MARSRRLRAADLLRHVMSRGNGRMQIFFDDVDYRKFLHLLGDVADAYDVECWDFCLMPNHYHLALRNRRSNLSEALRHLNGEYAQWWNATHGKVGHVFQGRFKDQIVQREGYLLTLIRYIALNPVRAKLVAHPADWKWSSYRTTAGLFPNPGFLRSDLVLEAFGDGAPVSLQERYIRHILAPSEDEDARAERLRSKERVLGDHSFKAAVLKETQDEPGMMSVDEAREPVWAIAEVEEPLGVSRHRRIAAPTSDAES